MPDIGSLDKRISFIVFKDVENDFGLDEQEQQVKLTCWARIEALRGKEYYEAQKIRTENTYKITTRYRKGLNQTMLIRYQGRLFEIQNIIDPYMNHSILEFMCVEKQRGQGVST